MNKAELYREIAKQKVEMTPDERMAAYRRGENVKVSMITNKKMR